MCVENEFLLYRDKLNNTTIRLNLDPDFPKISTFNAFNAPLNTDFFLMIVQVETTIFPIFHEMYPLLSHNFMKFFFEIFMRFFEKTLSPS